MPLTDFRNEPIFNLVQMIEIERATGDKWKKAGIVFAENNGWDWEGNTYLLEIYDIPDLEEELKNIGVTFWDFAKVKNCYFTVCFGFNDYCSDYFFSCDDIDNDTIELCSKVMDELGIRWCGWFDPPIFNLVATEAQIRELASQLEPHIAEWRKKYGYSIPPGITENLF